VQKNNSVKNHNYNAWELMEDNLTSTSVSIQKGDIFAITSDGFLH